MTDQFVEVVRGWIGTKFRFRGFEKTGCDCGGLIVGAIIELCWTQYYNNIILSYKQHREFGAKYINSQKIITTLGMSMQQLPANTTPQNGDILVFNLSMPLDKNKLGIVHIGVANVNGKTISIIHANRIIGAVEEVTFDSYWQQKIFCIFRLRPQNNVV